jgi:uncharacterized protein YbaR (Trm112 family)
MIIEYQCLNTQCHCEAAQPYEVQIRSEAVMDEKNVATLFCPHCQNRLVRSPEPSDGNGHTIEYRCPNTHCRNESTRPYAVQIRSEAVMDEKNVATLFCPRCKGRLVRSPGSSDVCTCC